jgi:RNAse (barnase) inhibitor barstar
MEGPVSNIGRAFFRARWYSNASVGFLAGDSLSYDESGRMKARTRPLRFVYEDPLMRMEPMMGPGLNCFSRLICSISDATNFAWKMQQQTVVRTLRGTKMGSEDRLYDEFAAALQFPYYFGENWDALDECLRDLGWLSGEGYLLVITNAARVLERERYRQLPTLIRILERAHAEWGKPVTLGEAWDRPARPFHVIVHAEANESATLCRLFPQARNEVNWPD